MKTEIIPFNTDLALSRAISMLKNGGLIAFPTDTVYGLACSLTDPVAIDKVFLAKERPKEKPLPILIGEQEHIKQVSDYEKINEPTRMLMQHFWPGAMTIILPKHSSIPNNLSPFETVGVRMPDHQRLLHLLSLTGPLAVTSANKSGLDNPTTTEEVFAQLGGDINLILDGGKTSSPVPSTVIASTIDDFQILRQGAITQEDIAAIFQ